MVTLTLAQASDLARLEPMVAAYHSTDEIDSTTQSRADALTPLLEGSPHGAVYMIGPRVAPIGYIVVTFGWSVEFGGLDGFIDEFFIREGVRGRGVGSEVLTTLLPRLEEAGLRALHLEASAGDARLARFYARHGFRRRDGFALMTREARPR